MNPSADGWIKKLLKDVSKNETYLKLSSKSFYNQLKLSGYIYGNNIDVVCQLFDRTDWTDEEICKVNHLLALYYIHGTNTSDIEFVESVNIFYKTVDTYKESVIHSLLSKKQSYLLLESIIYRRIHTNDNVLTKNFNFFIANALLCIDLLAYSRFLKVGQISDLYIQKMELCIDTLALNVFELKIEKSKYDKNLIKLFKSSLRYQSKESKTYKDVIKIPKNLLEKKYCIDISCMAAWTDKEIDQQEHLFLIQLAKDLHIRKDVVEQSMYDINTFYSVNKDQLPLLSKKNMVQNFYGNSSKMVVKLINRNSKRLIQELRESKELVFLLTKSTNKSLTEAEQKKVKEQLMDIIKSIPSLAIFLLPGGAILLPLLVKLIPKLLPSAFDANRIDE